MKRGKQKCPDCKGVGCVDRPGEKWPAVCERCKGDGTVKKDESETVGVI